MNIFRFVSVGLVCCALSGGSSFADCTTNPPLFDLTGPICPSANLLIPCQCSEGMVWDPDPSATSYEINRETPSSGTRLTVGTIVEQTWLDEDGPHRLPPPAQWFFAKDSAFPQEGVEYRYRVRACNSIGCGPWNEDSPTSYVAAPYACFDGGREVSCYVGDPVVTH